MALNIFHNELLSKYWRTIILVKSRSADLSSNNRESHNISGKNNIWNQIGDKQDLLLSSYSQG